jgi:hypothetical protein
MSLTDWLSHIEWLVGGAFGSALAAFCALYWVWDYARKSDEKVRAEFCRADEKISDELKTVTEQMRAFQAYIYTRADANMLESKLFARTDRIETKVDNISVQINQLIGRVGRL